jgi:hypothetical protein
MAWVHSYDSMVYDFSARVNAHKMDIPIRMSIERLK